MTDEPKRCEIDRGTIGKRFALRVMNADGEVVASHECVCGVCVRNAIDELPLGGWVTVIKVDEG